jgi:hypothetical protein
MEQGRLVDRGPMMGFFRQLEERLLLPEVRSSGDELSRLPTDNFIELGSSGAIYTKQQIIDSLAQEKRWSGPPQTSLFKCLPRVSFYLLTIQPAVILALVRNGIRSEVQSGSGTTLAGNDFSPRHANWLIALEVEDEGLPAGLPENASA